jgi:hypothetical protein
MKGLAWLLLFWSLSSQHPSVSRSFQTEKDPARKDPFTLSCGQQPLDKASPLAPSEVSEMKRTFRLSLLVGPSTGSIHLARTGTPLGFSSKTGIFSCLLSA